MTENENIAAKQREVCERHDVTADPVALTDRVGIARDFDPAIDPIHALRHPRHGNMCGWYLWSGAGEMPDDPDYVRVIHAAHLDETCPALLPYLSLPPGWRVLLGASGYRDVWFDDKLLAI